MPLGRRTHQQHIAGEPRQTDRRLRHVFGGNSLEIHDFALVDDLRGRERIADRVIHLVRRHLNEALHDDCCAVCLVCEVVLLLFDETGEADLHLLQDERVEPVRKNGSPTLKHGISFRFCIRYSLAQDYCILTIPQGFAE